MDTAGENAVEQNEDDQRNSDLNLSDVLKVLQDADGSPEERAEAMARQPHPALAQHAYVRIVEQPAPKALRFRYECEGRSAGSIQGVNSTPDRRTFPTIEIGGYVGTVLIVVCCVTCDEPYLSHPHKLVGSDCKNGVHSVRCEISPDSRTVSFPRLGVQCVKRKDVADALLQREHAKIDPFRHGFAHRHNPQSINLNAVRLCFSVYLEDGNGHYRHRLPPAVSDVVYDKKAMSELLISRVSACTASARGGLQIIMLCDKVNRDEITVVFEERKGDAAVWRDAASIDHVHKLCAIVCTVPAYRNPKVTTEVETYLFLERRTDKACSNEIKFKYLPEFDYSAYMNGKKRKILDTREIESYERDRPATSFSREPQIKLEPRDVGLRSPQQEMSPRNPYYQEYPPWNMAGPSVGSFQYGQLTGGPLPSMGMAGLAPSPGMAGLAPSPALEAQSPGLRGLSPGMQAQSPLMQAASPIMQVDSPHMQAPSPNMQAQSPHMQAPSPHLQAPSPHGQVPSPHMQAATHMQAQCQPMHMLAQPSGSHVDLISSIVMQQPMLQQQQQQQQQQQPQLQEAAAASGELSTLSGLLAFLERAPDLSDSLNRLSTSDLYQ